MNSHDMTIVYYTSNMDYPCLEEAVRATIVEHSNGLPIVSVSQSSINFGHNIVVGDIGRSYKNIFMQMRLGVEYASTKYIAICEADFLLPPAFFAFRPPHDKIYCWPKDGYITWNRQTPLYYRKRMTQTVGIVGRDHLLSFLDVLENNTSMSLYRLIPRLSETGLFDLGSVVTLKTHRGIHWGSPHCHNNPLETLPEWGPAQEMWAQYGG